jgi:hypothetical protein
MNKVYIIQNSMGKNFEPAKEFGALTIMLRGNETPAEALKILNHHLQDFTATDFLLLVGSPVFIVMATIVAWQQLSPDQPLAVLVWDKQHYKYNCERIDIP